jgi:dimethylargininase
LLALTRAVPPSIAQCELTHLERDPIDWARADEQHRQYERALESLGCRVQRLAPEPSLPDSVFVEDTAVVVNECAVIARPGAESRRPEIVSVAEALKPYRRLRAIEAPGTLDGGDVVCLGSKVFVGISSRTNEEGARQLATYLAPHGYSLTCVHVKGCLHLKTAVSALPDRRLLINPRFVATGAFGGARFIPIDPSEPYSANVLSVNEGILSAAAFPATSTVLEKAGYRVVRVDASELAKAEAGLTCCSLLLHAAH